VFGAFASSALTPVARRDRTATWIWACTELFGCPAFREEEGRVVIDETLCNGCGVCVALCPNGAIHEVPAP